MHPQHRLVLAAQTTPLKPHLCFFVYVYLPLVQIVGSTYQVLESPNPATYIGSGKVAEVAAAVQAAKVRLGAHAHG
jgi:hypothetical protein